MQCSSCLPGPSKCCVQRLPPLLCVCLLQWYPHLLSISRAHPSYLPSSPGLVVLCADRFLVIVSLCVFAEWVSSSLTAFLVLYSQDLHGCTRLAALPLLDESSPSSVDNTPTPSVPSPTDPLSSAHHLIVSCINNKPSFTAPQLMCFCICPPRYLEHDIIKLSFPWICLWYHVMLQPF